MFLCIYMVPTSTFGSVLSRRVYNVVWVVFGVALPLSCLLVTGSKLVRALQAQRRQNEVAAAGHARHQQQCYGRVSVCPSVTNSSSAAVLRSCVRLSVCQSHQQQCSQFSQVTTTVVGTAASFVVLVCPSIVVESVGLIVGAETLSDPQLDVYRTVIVLLNLCQTIKFAGNFVFFVRVRRDCGRRGTDADRSAMELCRLRSADVARSTHHTEQTGAGRPSINVTVSSTWPSTETNRRALTTITLATV